MVKKLFARIVVLTGTLVVGWVILNVLLGLFATSIVFMPGIISLALAILITVTIFKAVFGKEGGAAKK